MRTNRFFGILLICIFAAHAYAQNQSDTLARRGWFTYAPYGKSLLSDVHPYYMRLDVIGHANEGAFDFGQTGKAYRAGIHGCFGADIPLWQGNFGPNNRFGMCVSQRAYAYLWLDIFEPVTAPVVNTDYRVGAATATFIHRLNKGFAKNYSITWSPFMHESTHIGDELQIQRMETGYAIRRVNVSYNWTELVFTLNEPENRHDACHTFRAGLMLLWDWKEGWYSVKESAGDGDASLVHPRNSPWEAFVQYQYQTPTSPHGIQGVMSAEVRNRVVYGYDLYLKKGETDTRGADSRRFTYNVFLGMRYNIPGYDGFFSRVAFGARLYHGNCPFGQFRSIDTFSMFGFSVIYQ